MATDKDFLKWIREVINPQASYGNNACVGDYSKDGSREYIYPFRFVVNGDSYSWDMGSRHTKGRHLSTHYELWFHGQAFHNHARVATGQLTVSKLRKGLRVIYDYYKNFESEGQK